MILKKIARHIQGDVISDELTRHIYSVDASIYEIKPVGIVLPRTIEDIQTTVKLAAEEGIPLIPRGGATGIAGGCIGQGIIIDTSRYFDKIVTIDPLQCYAHCQAGVIQDQLNHAVSAYGLRLGAETSTGNRATIGGMVSTNAAGAHYLHYGSMADHVLEVRMVMHDGSLAVFNKTWPLAFKSSLEKLTHETASLIQQEFPRLKRRSSGYLLDRLSFPAQFVAGSEGTFGIITDVKVALKPIIASSSLHLFFYSSLDKCLDAIPELLSYKPLSLELIDHHVISMGRLSPSLKGRLDWIPTHANAFLIGEYPQAVSIPSDLIVTDKKEDVWALRKAGFGLLLSRRSYTRAIAFIEDLSVPPEHLKAFVKDLLRILSDQNLEVGIYGHAGDGCLHIRPFLNLHEEKDLTTMIQLMSQATELVKRYEGVLSGEHGDGIVRSWLNERLFGPAIYQVFEQIKKIFDPLGIMNPGKIVGKENPVSHLRLSPKTRLTELPTFLNFEKEGGFHLAADLCNGNGECRKQQGLMCPSFHGEKDERMTTRGRAQSLRAILNGNAPLDLWTSKELYEVLEYCLECKGCKTECPSQVDMAKMKAEFLYQYQEKNGYSLRSLFFGRIGNLFQMGSFFPRLFNQVGNWSYLKSLLKVTPHRSLPALAPQRFSDLWKKKQKDIPDSVTQVVLFIDTFTEFIEPEVGVAAVDIFSYFGIQTLILPWECCGRPAFSKGLLKESKRSADRLLGKLEPFVEKGIPIVGLEPSCLFTLKDDYGSFFSDTRTLAVANACMTFEEFLLSHLPPNPPFFSRPVHVHVHCHQQSAKGPTSTLELLKKLFNAVHFLGLGCCGLAGSFGYEKEHHALSEKIGEHRLFPLIRQLPVEDFLCAGGFSCRTQILHGTGRKAYHPAQIIHQLLQIDN